MLTGVVVTGKQCKALEFLSFKYGNGGAMCSGDNHKFLALLIVNNPAEASKYLHRITDSCREAVARVLKNDFSELRDNQRMIIAAIFFGDHRDEEKKEEKEKANEVSKG